MTLAGFLLFSLAQVPTADPLAAAIKALDSGQPQEAVKLLQAAAGKTPDDVAIQFHLGLAHALAGQDAPAVEAYKATLKLKPDLYEAQVNLGQVLLRSKSYAEAETYLKQAVAQKPKEVKVNLLLGQAVAAQGNAAGAIPYFQVAAEIDPKSPDAWANLGRSLALVKKPAEAAEAFEKAVALEPANSDFLLECASLYEAAGKRAEAIAFYKRAPGNPAARERIGNLLLEDGKPAEAVEHLEFAQKASPTAANRYALAVAYLRTKQPDAAIPLVQKILEETPNNQEVRMFYGRMLRDQKRYLAAATQFQKVTQAEPDRADAWNEFATVLILAEQYPEAVSALEQVRRLKGETPAYHYFRALSLDHLKQYKPALDSYKRFLELSKDQSPDEEFKARQRVIVIQKVLSK